MYLYRYKCDACDYTLDWRETGHYFFPLTKNHQIVTLKAINDGMRSGKIWGN